MATNTVREVQDKILEIMLFIDDLCRKNNITYCIMGGTALGAVRHGGFIPWDDDLDIFMTPSEYEKFKKCFQQLQSETYVLQEWKTTEKYLEYAKIRMNGTTFIEEHFKDRKDMHHGIYVDIMILHKVPKKRWIQKMIYLQSKYVTLYALSQRNWRPKTKAQGYVLNLLKILPNRLLAKICYRNIYRYDDMQQGYDWCYFITPAKFRSGIFAADFFDSVSDISFDGHMLMGPAKIKEYLAYRYGDYMKLPSKEQQQAAVHAMLYDTEKDYKEYLEKINE